MSAAQKPCPECHNLAPVEAQFCMKCGERFPVSAFPPAPVERTCPQCRRELGAFESVCLHCQQSEMPPFELERPAPPPPPPPPFQPQSYQPQYRPPTYAPAPPPLTQFPHVQCFNCKQWVPQTAGQCQTCGAMMPAPQFSAAPYQNHYYPLTPYRPRKDKTAAGLFGILLGAFGGQHFYLGNYGAGILSLLFSWTYIPALIGLIQGIIFLCMDEDEFHRRHG